MVTKMRPAIPLLSIENLRDKEASLQNSNKIVKKHEKPILTA